MSFPILKEDIWQLLFKGYVVARQLVRDSSIFTVWDNEQHHGNLAWYCLKMGFTYYCAETTVAVRKTFIANLLQRITGI
jgi:hypothetical protein